MIPQKYVSNIVKSHVYQDGPIIFTEKHKNTFWSDNDIQSVDVAVGRVGTKYGMYHKCKIPCNQYLP